MQNSQATRQNYLLNPRTSTLRWLWSIVGRHGTECYVNTEFHSELGWLLGTSLAVILLCVFYGQQYKFLLSTTHILPCQSS